MNLEEGAYEHRWSVENPLPGLYEAKRVIEILIKMAEEAEKAKGNFGCPGCGGD